MDLPSLRFSDFHPTPASLKEEVLQGLSRTPKTIAPKFFYDNRGSQLFDAICKLPEYYPTRTEIGILRSHADDIAQRAGPDCLLVELGSGSSQKIRILLEALRPSAYMPLDISRDHLLQAARVLARDYPWLDVHATCIDYSQSWALPDSPAHTKKVAFFPGSSIGNFDPEAARLFLKRLATVVGPHGGLLIGVDLKKDVKTLHAAYNDAQGVTAAFNLNLLDRINRELGANFDLETFRHWAFYNEARGRIEMHLGSLRNQDVSVAGQRFHFERDETIHTENSYKYRVVEFQQLASDAGFCPEDVWTDSARRFSVHYFSVRR